MELHGSSLCSREWLSQLSMGGESLGSVKVLCSSIGECKGQEGGVGGLVSRSGMGAGGGVVGFWRRNQEREISI